MSIYRRLKKLDVRLKTPIPGTPKLEDPLLFELLFLGATGLGLVVFVLLLADSVKVRAGAGAILVFVLIGAALVVRRWRIRGRKERANALRNSD